MIYAVLAIPPNDHPLQAAHAEFLSDSGPAWNQPDPNNRPPGLIVPPFRLRPERDETALLHGLDAQARRQARFPLPLALGEHGFRIMLMPRGFLPHLDGMAGSTLRALDSFRNPVTEADTANLLSRANDRAAEDGLSLTPNQQTILARWGDPYVMGEFRYGLPLGPSIADPARRAATMTEAKARFANALTTPWILSSLTLIRQSDETAPWEILSTAQVGL